ncbi:hypothetical protein AB0J20_16175 [Micromonospora costi]|uniref:hypothetical protein n=1 Tax=Micromonospora costi TaxID=1530042 RepID=UPI0033C546C4
MRHLIAATPPVVMGLLVLAGWATYYVAECCWWQFGKCWCCKGRGRHHRKDGKVFRDCHWCRGSGRRLRVGRRVWNRFAKVRNASK